MTSIPIRRFETVAPYSYLVLAIDLADAADQASRRSALDRAYYAAFLTARNELANKGYLGVVRGSEAHARVSEELEKIDRRVAERLTMLRRARNRLTYQTGRIVLQNEQTLQSLLDSASIVIEAVRALPVNS